MYELSVVMETVENTLRDRFWAELPRLPSGLSLQQREPIVATRPGRGGAAVYDVVDLSTPAGPIPLLAAYQERLLASQVEAVAARLAAVISQRGERARALGRRDSRSLVPTIITDLAKPSVVAACEQRGIALLDRRGTIVLNASPSFIHVVGRAAVEPTSRGRLFSGKASRIVRFLLSVAAPESPPVARSTHTIAKACDLSYVYAYSVLTKLERDGFVNRSSSHGGFRLRNPVRLLEAWIASGEQAARATEAFYCPATSRQSLFVAANRVAGATGTAPLFTLASALEEDEVHVAALPHGVYWPGELGPIVEAFGLTRTTPRNFRVLIPDPIVWTTAGGLLQHDPARPTSHDAIRRNRVCTPQLIVDFSAIHGRGREQADFLLARYAAQLPFIEDRQ